MAYTKQTWQDLPSKTTPINASRLGHIEQGIYDAASTADTAASNASSAISGLADKVDKVEGKGLSTNDFTDTLKTKLDNIETGAEVNVQSDWNQSDNSADDYIKNKPSLGTSAYKNSTSVVTQSSDLVESGAVYDALVDAEVVQGKNKFDLSGDSALSNTTRTILSDGINVKSSSSSWASCIYFFENVKNTDMRFKTSLDFVSGHIQVIVYGNSTPATAGATSIISSNVYTADGNVDLQFNSGNYEYLVIRFFVTTGTAEVGEANFNSIMLCKASEGGAYEPYYIPLKDVVPNKCDNSVIGTVEDGVNPTKSYAVGEHMIRGGKFCTITSPVTTSSTWTLGSNYVEGTIADNLVKQDTFSGTTSSGGNLKLYNGTDRIVLSIIPNENWIYGSIFHDNSGNTQGHFNGSAGDIYASQSVSGTYYYI